MSAGQFNYDTNYPMIIRSLLAESYQMQLRIPNRQARVELISALDAREKFSRIQIGQSILYVNSEHA